MHPNEEAVPKWNFQLQFEDEHGDRLVALVIDPYAVSTLTFSFRIAKLGVLHLRLIRELMKSVTID